MSKISIEQIPPLTSVAIQVMRFDPDHPESDTQKMENLIKPDKGICAEIMKIANSAFYGRSGKIKSIKDAITFLGLKTIKNIVMMLASNNMKGKRTGKTFRKYLQEFPIITAMVGLDISPLLGLRELKEAAFLNGLLYKIGMTIIAINRPVHYSSLLEIAKKDNRDIMELEKENYEINHIEVGLLTFREWKIPDEFLEIMENQDFDPDKTQDQKDIVRLIALSSTIAKTLLEMPVVEKETERRNCIINHYAVDSEKLKSFNEEYLENLQDHPFYRYAILG